MKCKPAIIPVHSLGKEERSSRGQTPRRTGASQGEEFCSSITFYTTFHLSQVTKLSSAWTHGFSTTEGLNSPSTAQLHHNSISPQFLQQTHLGEDTFCLKFNCAASKGDHSTWGEKLKYSPNPKHLQVSNYRA